MSDQPKFQTLTGSSALAAELRAMRARAEVAEAALAGTRACLDSLVADIGRAFGERYQAIIDEASGDISVNTAFKVALRDEREASKEVKAALVRLRAELEALAQKWDEASMWEAENSNLQFASGMDSCLADVRACLNQKD